MVQQISRKFPQSTAPTELGK